MTDQRKAAEIGDKVRYLDGTIGTFVEYGDHTPAGYLTARVDTGNRVDEFPLWDLFVLPPETPTPGDEIRVTDDGGMWAGAIGWFVSEVWVSDQVIVTLVRRDEPVTVRVNREHVYLDRWSDDPLSATGEG
jgi:hypothetical protein